MIKKLRVTYLFLLFGLATFMSRAGSAEPMIDQARQQAARYWESVLTKCGESYFVACRQSNYPGQAYGYDFELKDVSFTTDEVPLTPADKANGFEWKGRIRIFPKLYRYLSSRKKGESAIWKDASPTLVGCVYPGASDVTIWRKAG